MIEEGRRTIAEADNVRFVVDALALQTSRAWGVLQDDATAAGLRDHPDLADDDASGTDDDFRRWYAARFPITCPVPRGAGTR